MSAAVHGRVVSYGVNKKCGEIRMTPTATYFQLVCDRCAETYTVLEAFIKHVRQRHAPKDRIAIKTNMPSVIKLIPVQSISKSDVTKSGRFSETMSKLSVPPAMSQDIDPLQVVPTQIIKDEPLDHNVSAEDICRTHNETDDVNSDKGFTCEKRSSPASRILLPQTQTQQQPQSSPSQTINNSIPITTIAKTSEEELKLITFIDAIKRSPLLWDPEHIDFFNEPAKSEALDNVANILNAKFRNFQLDADVVMTKIRNLYATWISLQNGYTKPTWYYDRLGFFAKIKNAELLLDDNANSPRNIARIAKKTLIIPLDDQKKKSKVSVDHVDIHKESTEFNQTIDMKDSAGVCKKKEIFIEKNKTTSLSHISPTLPPQLHLTMDTTVEQVSYFIELFEQKEVLWNCKHADYLNKFEQNLAYVEIATKMVKKFIFESFFPQTIRKNVIDLQILFYKMETEEIPKSWYYDKLKFLQIAKNKEELEFIQRENAEKLILRDYNANIEYAVNKLVEETNIDMLTETDISTVDILIDDEFDRMSQSSLFEGFSEINGLDDDRITRLQMLLKPINATRMMMENSNVIDEGPKNENVENEMHQEADAHSKTKLYKCDKCPRTFVSACRRAEHLLRHLHPHELPYLCDVCGLSFRNRDYWRVHSYKHTGDWPFVCEVCKMGFGRHMQLRRHQTAHTQERPYVCDMCGKTFRTLASSIDHRRRHTKDKRYECETCKKRFYTSYKLSLHKKRHDNLPSYECDECGKRFFDREGWRTHKLIHSKVPRYECCICGQRFKQLASRYNHMKQKHGLVKGVTRVQEV